MTDKAVALPGHAGFIKNNLRNYGMLLSLFAIMLFFQVMTDGTLLQPLNLTNLVLQNSYIVIMALGMLLIIVTGHIDLSVGSVAGFVGAVAAVLMVRYHVAYPLAFVACLLVGAAIGAAQGYWVAYFKIPSFIVTLAGMLVFKGLALAILQGAVGRAVSADLPEIVLGLHSRTVSRRRHALPDVAADRCRPRGGAGLYQCQGPGAAGLARDRGRALWLLRRQERSAVRRDRVLRRPDRLASRPAQRAGDHDRADRALCLRHHPHGDWPSYLCHRRQRQGRKPVRHQDRTADVPDLHQHGRAGGARRPRFRRAAQYGNPEGGGRVRARRHRGLLHRRARRPVAASAGSAAP